MRAKFSVTYETFTNESVSEGDAAERGYLLEGATLREAVDELLALPAVDSIEADTYPLSRANAPRWFTATQGSDWPLYAKSEEDAGESRALHIPDSITPASRMRLARVLGCDGAR